MKKKLNILISNDDGVYAEGINALHQELVKIANVVVVAPDRDRSGASNSLTLTRPIQVRQLANGFFSVEGTPTDCVHLAITELLDQKPDFVVSGINHDANLGDDILYSGTVAAATEGTILGCPSVAVSLASKSLSNLPCAAKVTKEIIMLLSSNVLSPKNTLLNINVPDVPYADILGFDVTRLGARHQAVNMIKDTDPRGQEIYWVGAPGPEQDAAPGTDFYTISSNKVSVTPIQIDFTNYGLFDHVATWLKDFGKDTSK